MFFSNFGLSWSTDVDYLLRKPEQGLPREMFLEESLKKHFPEGKFFLCLLDKSELLTLAQTHCYLLMSRLFGSGYWCQINVKGHYTQNVVVGHQCKCYCFNGRVVIIGLSGMQSNYYNALCKYVKEKDLIK